jgi:hypothetical protein
MYVSNHKHPHTYIHAWCSQAPRKIKKEEKTMALVKDMQRIAARKLHNTRGVPRNMKDKLELIDLAFGRAAVLEDFENWCDEHADKSSPYPVTEYLRMVDSRLGGTPKIDPDDDRIKELMAITFELTSVLPHLRGIRDLLAIHSAEEIKAALKYYILTVDEKDMKSSVRAFYDDLGASAVIYTMKKKG